MDHRKILITLAEAYAARTNRSLARIGTLVQNSGAFFERLRAGKALTTDTFNKVLLWFSDNWPADLPWPAEISRPADSQSKAESAA
jgi:hypothetical protein